MSTADQVMETFIAQWYNALTGGLGLDPNHFQLIQASVPLGTTSDSIWPYFDAIPPATLTHYYNPSQINSFAANYGGVIMNLKPQNATTFNQIMGDYASRWNKYLGSYTGLMPAGGPLQLFSNWAWANIPNPGTAQAAITAYAQQMNGIVSTAFNMYVAAKPRFAYNGTYAQLSDAVRGGPGAKVEMDSSNRSSDVSHTWANGQVWGGGGSISGQAGGSFAAQAVALANAGVVVSATYQHVVTYTAPPLSQPSDATDLSEYRPWFNSAALGLAYGTKDNTVWNNTPPTWESTFGASGNLRRMTTGIVVVDGIDVTITSAAAVSSDDQKAIQAAASAGIWPFVQVSAAGGWTSAVNFQDRGRMQARFTLPAGNPQILGTMVTAIGEVLGVDPSVRVPLIAASARL